ncbi:DEKNAAC101359 [Brettanomyces naardenensis]|uniref:DEKNAAC101359 n=1 Tax=Brettanomyces naardenensis TaxID=13370 RepID=A0A448YHI5_BRENA|nr:DEKNAAC101359 [Brettanomyces naardenensis]
MSFRGTQFPQGNRDVSGASFGLRSQPAIDPLAQSRQPSGEYHHQYRRDSDSRPPHSIDPLEAINGLIPSDNHYVKKFEKFSEQVEDLMDQYLGVAKPYVPSIGRFLIVATFLEDSLRIVSQWKEQVYYLSTFRHLYEWVVRLFLLFNVLSMCAGSFLVITRRKPELATGLLSSIVLLQGLVYGLLFESFFFLRNVSVIGGLLLALSDSIIIDKRKLMMPGLPMLESKDHKKYILLAGRIMLIVLFLAFTMNVKLSIFSFFIVLLGSICCFSVAIGYKTKFSAAILTVLLAFYNVLTNHYWTYDWKDTRRDYLRYEFFQTLSIVGGLLLIVNTGAGELSIDEKKKKY